MTEDEKQRRIDAGWEPDGFGGFIEPDYQGPMDDDGLPLGTENP